MARDPESLKALGRHTAYSQDYAPEVLETFENQHPDNDYWVRFNCPEFTTLCPITGQPDFAEIRISYAYAPQSRQSTPSFSHTTYLSQCMTCHPLPFGKYHPHQAIRL